MGTLGDRAVGFGLLSFTSLLFAYYSFWVLITPFIEPKHFVHSYFPERYYAITIPVTLLVVGLTVIFTFLSLVMIKSKK